MISVLTERFSSEDLYNRIKQEYKRLKRRKQLKYPKHSETRFSRSGNASCGSSSGSDNDDVSSPLPNESRIARENDRSSNTPAALFTLEQVVTICNKLLVDRDNVVREEYDRALSERLAGSNSEYQASNCFDDWLK